ncbi:MAG: alanine racemase [Bacteroidales bacterium]|jgi:alanine racemase|nr:alanine racemase [Bacteroidales bacterium]
MHHSTLRISRKNLLHNYKYYSSKLSQSTKMLVLVKANAYGHGDIEISRLVADFGADYLGVAFPSEGIRLKKAGICLPIIILTPGTGDYEELIEHGLEPSLASFETAYEFVRAVKKLGKTNYPVHIKLDTGMSRVGFRNEQLSELTDFLKENSCLHVNSVFSHLSSAEYIIHDNFTLGQIEEFSYMYDKISESIDYKPIKHILNSSGILRYPQYQFDMVRLGIGLYGSSYVDGSSYLMPAAELQAPVINVSKISNRSVGYGRYGRVSSEEKEIATIPLGYADGINRHLGRGNVSFSINGHMAPTIGNICMDMFMMDVTGCNVKVGDIVTIFGENPSAIYLANLLDTITYEIFTSVSARVKREICE